MPEHDLKLSKILSVILRHNPEAFGLTLADGGWVLIDDLILAIQRQKPRYATLQRSDLEQLIVTSDKQRYEIQGDRIRAFYGHTVEVDVQYDAIEPPALLYHGTSHKTVPIILEEGLKPMRRQYVHLSADYQTARIVGQRQGGRVVVLQVDAGQAYADGIVFYQSHDAVWLVEAMPPQYLTLVD